MGTQTIRQDPNSNTNKGWPANVSLDNSTTRVIFTPQSGSEVTSVSPLPDPPFSNGGTQGATYQVDYSHVAGTWTPTITWQALPGAGGGPPAGSTTLTLGGG